MAFSRVDDIDGTTPAEEYQFSLNGRMYVLDLSEHNRIALAQAMAPFVDVAREIPMPTPRRAPKPKAAKRDDLAEVRAWAKQQGMEVNERGRVAREILDAYDEAHAA
jgi:Lsr2